MLIMETIAKIRRLYHVKGKGFKTIARELKLSKNTVKKIIREDMTSFSYQREKAGHRVLENYVVEITEKLEHDANEPKRRKRTVKKIVEELRKLGYTGSYDAVHEFVRGWHRDKKQWKTSAFVPLEFSPGEAFQFDWSTEEILLAGVLTQIKVAQIRLCYSRYFLLIAYPNEQLEMVLDAHNRAFAFFKGVCQKGIYDNMKTAVKTVLVGKEREWNPRFKEMCSHHLFEPVACTPAAGWEKGQVEHQVSTGRCNFFTPLVKVDTLDTVNGDLGAWCMHWAKNTAHPEQKDKTVFAVYEEERAFLLSYRGPCDAYKLEHDVVSPYCFVNHATNFYSAECGYVGQAVELRIYAKEIVIVHRGTLIGRHRRSFLRYQRIYDPWHYVPILERKPGALRNGAPFKQLVLPESLQKIREQLSHRTEGDKCFIRILLKVSSHGLAAVEQACAFALAAGGANDTLVLQYLEPPLNTNVQEMQPLSHPPSEQCEHYNAAFLTQPLSLGVGYAS
jgi:transposase